MASAPAKYNKDSDGNEIYSKENNMEVIAEKRYALDKDKVPFYPRDAYGNEFMDEELGLIERNGKYEYPRTVDGKPHYRVDPNDQGVVQKQLYEKIKDKWIIGTDDLGNMVYAKDSNGDEYYPEDNTPAKKSNGAIFYARTAATKEVVFPKNEDGDEFYLTFVDPSEPDTIPDRYARTNNDKDEIYPQRFIKGNIISDHLIGNAYAERDGQKYYPKDGYNNEFYITPAPNTGVGTPPTDIVLDSYAVTNDGKIILPSIGGMHYIDPNRKPTVTQNDIIGKLVREENVAPSDYLTKVEVSVKPKVSPREYKYFDVQNNIFKTVKPPSSSSTTPPQIPPVQITATHFFKRWWYVWLLIVSIVILKSFVVWLFFFRPLKN